MILCANCKAPYPDQGAPYLCPRCGGIFDSPTIIYPPKAVVDRSLPGIWRYWHTFSLPEKAPMITLGEGNTPLIWGEALGRRVAFKCEYQNPTGSFKDRGSATLVSYLASRGISMAVEDSSGNAGASFAAYAARAAIRARVYVPETASGPKRKQIEAYGAEVVAVPGPREKATESVQRAVEAGMVYASHACMPFNLAGYATIAYEMVEQLGGAPGVLICPVGQGGFLLGAARGFNALLVAGIITHLPKLIGVQVRACAPLHWRYMNEPPVPEYPGKASTLAEGIRVLQPVRAEAVVQAVFTSKGNTVVVDEVDILPGRDELAHRGFYVETTSAIVWGAMTQLFAEDSIYQIPEPIVVVLTGSGLKTA